MCIFTSFNYYIAILVHRLKNGLEEPCPCRELQHVISLVDGELKGRQLAEKTANCKSTTVNSLGV